MSLFVFLTVMTAAMLHALWNVLVKGGADKRLGMAAVVLGHLPLALVALAIVPAPAPASYPYLFAGIGLHAGYQFFLLNSYRIGDLTQVYPIARGSAPLLVALVSVGFLGVRLQAVELLAVLIIGAGIISMSLVRQNDGLKNHRAAVLAFLTGCFIASYSLVDGLGARLAGTSLGFYAWLGIGNAVIFAVYLLATSPRTLLAVPKQGKWVFLFGGAASFTAYSLVIWAFTQAPIALVTGLRETSIIFALLLGVFFLGERMDLAKLVATFTTLFGAALLRFSR
ncbi:MAG: EamA family transporter [Rhodobacteraceae bacterium]|nr:EamA family transporter [Paracoccaceae bacterium]